MTTDEEQNKMVIRRFFDAWNRHEADALVEFVVPNVVRHCPATPHIAVRTVDELKEFLRQDTTVFPDSVQTIVHSVAEGDLLATWATYEGTQQGPLGRYPPTGVKGKFGFSAVFRMENARIAEWWVTWDNLGILKALGHVPNA